MNILDLNLKYRTIKGKQWQLNLEIPHLIGRDIFNNIRNKDDIEYNLFYTKNIFVRDRLDNICYLSHVLNTNYSSLNLTEVLKGNIINVIRNIQFDINNEYVLINLGPEQTIYLNILARNLKTNELITYIPIEGKTTKPISRMKKVFILFLVIILLALVIKKKLLIMVMRI